MNPTSVQEWASFAGLCQESVAALEHALQVTPAELTEQVDVAERVVVRLRDSLIEWVRRDGSSVQRTRWLSALQRVNAALSLIVGVEYPAAGFQKSLLVQARDTLIALQADGG
jgi:hypothetical protein